ncbi:MAG: transposase [Flavobacteriaceae bacterium]|nr:transposase [Flavobacteriaceae bacterium]
MAGYDYSQNNLYFVTSCVRNMDCCFGDVVPVGTGRDLSVHNPKIHNPKIHNPEIHNPEIHNPEIHNPKIHNPDENESEMILNEYGIIAYNQLEWLEIQYPYIELHSYVVMPNRIHALIEIDSLKVNSIHKSIIGQLDSENIKIKSLSQIMGAYKTTSSKLIHQANYEEFAWHRSFHDHIIRGEKSYLNIVNYIENNPDRWSKDKFYNK